MTATAAVNDREQSAIADVFVAFGLALRAHRGLGFFPFAYALLLPPMRADLGWTYLAAGGMNTACLELGMPQGMRASSRTPSTLLRKIGAG